MPQVFNHFVRFLMEHEPKRHYASRLWGIVGASLVIASLIAMPFSVPSGFAGLLLGIVLLFSQLVTRVKPSELAADIPGELTEVWGSLRWMASRRELSMRTHPELRDLLEEIAESRRTTLIALRSGAWKDRARTPEGAQTIRDIEVVLQTALYDSVFIGRHLFRGKGQRDSTFRSRCADPAFGRDALAAVGEIRDEVRALCESALAAGELSDLRVNLIQKRFQALVEAERELEAETTIDAFD